MTEDRKDEKKRREGENSEEEELTLAEMLKHQAPAKQVGENGEEPKEEELKKGLPGRYITVIVLGAIALVLLTAVVVYRSWAKSPDLPIDKTPKETATGGSQETLEPTQSGGEDELENFGGIQPYVDGDRKKGFYTFLIVGRDTAGGGNTDTIMLAAYDSVNQQAALMSIPRDTMVNATWDVKKINTVYNVNEASEEGSGVAALKRYVAGLTGFEPDFTVMVEWEAVGEIVEAIGGVYFEVPFFMHYADETQGLHIVQWPGYRLLNGDDAMQIVRWRHNNEGASDPPGMDGSDLGRTKIQQDFIAAVLRQCLQIKNVTKLTQLANIFTQRVETELTGGNLMWFAEQALLGGFSTDNLYTCTMPIAGAYDVYCRTLKVTQNFVTPDAKELLQVVNEHFNPYETDVNLSNLDIMSVNADGTIASSTGTVRDKKANAAIEAWLAPPETSPTGSEEPDPMPTESQPGQEGPGEDPPIESESPPLPPEENAPPSLPPEEPVETDPTQAPEDSGP